MSLAAGVRLGPYEVVGLLGAGRMGEVYRARDTRLDRIVALKTVRAGVGEHVDTARFADEIRIAAALTHPHIVPVFDAGDADGLLFYVMPFIAGESLRQRLRREGTIAVDAALVLAREIAGAIHFAHSRAVVHRDLKPDNILLSEGHALVADFGLALALDRATGVPTRPHAVLGTAG
jgi:serine/threonine protein kinase